MKPCVLYPFPFVHEFYTGVSVAENAKHAVELYANGCGLENVKYEAEPSGENRYSVFCSYGSSDERWFSQEFYVVELDLTIASSIKPPEDYFVASDAKRREDSPALPEFDETDDFGL